MEQPPGDQHETDVSMSSSNDESQDLLGAPVRGHTTNVAPDADAIGGVMSQDLGGGLGGAVPADGQDGTPATSAAKKKSRRSTIIKAIQLVLLALVVHFLVIPQLSSARSAWDTISKVRPAFLVAAAIVEVIAWLAYARMTVQLVSRAHRPSMAISFGTALASKAVSHVVPAGAAATAAVNVRLLRRAGVPAEELPFVLSTQSTVSALVLNVMLSLSLLIAIPITGLRDDYKIALWLGFALYLGIGLLLAAITKFTKPTADALTKVLGWLPGTQPGAVRLYVNQLADQIRALIGNRELLGRLLADAVINWVCGACALWVSLLAYGGHPSIIGLFVAYCLANVMAVVPISPGGLGIVEAVMISTLTAFGMDHGIASIGVVTFRLFSFWLPIPGGALAYLLVNRATGKHPPS